MGEAQKCVAELDVDEVFIGCLLWLLVFWCLVKGFGMLVGCGEQRVLLYWCLNCGHWMIFTFFLFLQRQETWTKADLWIKANVQYSFLRESFWLMREGRHACLLNRG